MVQVRVIDTPENPVLPLLGGLQIELREFGTLGCIFQVDSSFYGLTARHVVASTSRPDHQVGGQIEQGGQAIANLTGVGIIGSLDLDYAFFKIDLLGLADLDLDQSINGIHGKVVSFSSPVEGMKVRMHGATTFDSLDSNANAGFVKGLNQLDTFFEVSNDHGSLSRGGDSGAVWIEDNESAFINVVGLHIRGNSSFSSAVDFTKIMLDLSINHRNTLQLDLINNNQISLML